MPLKKILFIVNGLGLGNSTRCEAVIEHLSGFEVHVATSGNGLTYFRNSPHVHQLVHLRACQYGSRSGRLSLMLTLLSLPRLFYILLYNKWILFFQMNRHRYSAIVIDSDYSLMLAKLWIRAPIFSINNSDRVVAKLKHLVPRSMRWHYAIEKLDFLYHSLVPNFVLSPTFVPVPKAQSKWRHFAPIVRSQLSAGPAARHPVHVLLMPSGSVFSVQFKPIAEKLRRWPGLRLIEMPQNLYGNQMFLKQADVLIIHAGFSSISEAIILKKPALVIPIPNHAEQYANALSFVEMGFGLMATTENVCEQLEALLQNYSRFVEALEEADVASTGASEASRFIAENMK